MIQIDPLVTNAAEAMVLYRNVLSEGTLSASTTGTGGAVGNLLGPQTSDFWGPTALPATVAVALSAPVMCNCAAIIGHTLGAAGATAIIEYDDAGWQTAATITPTTDRDILLLFPDETSDDWRIRFTGASAALTVSLALIGPRLILPLGLAAGYTPITQAPNIDAMPSLTMGGQFQGARHKKRGYGTQVPLAPQERAWVDGAGAEFIQHYNEVRPFVFASAPSVLTKDFAYCWRTGQPLTPSYSAGAIYASMTMEVGAYVG